MKVSVLFCYELSDPVCRPSGCLLRLSLVDLSLRYRPLETNLREQFSGNLCFGPSRQRGTISWADSVAAS
jgi:hypothetical protein